MDPQQRALLIKSLTDPVLGHTEQEPPQNPFVLNAALETQAAPAHTPLNPVVGALMKRLGLLSLVRNRSNTNMTAGDVQ